MLRSGLPRFSQSPTATRASASLCWCPQAVDTPMLRRAGVGSQNVDGVLTPEQVAQHVVEAIEEERFEILPHPQVLGYMRKKTEDYSRWIGGMAKLRRALSKPAP